MSPENNIVLAALAEIERQRVIQSSQIAAQRAEDLARQLDSQNVLNMAVAQKERERRDRQARLLVWARSIGIGMISQDLQKLVSGDSGPVVEVLDGASRVIFKTFGGKTEGRALTSQEHTTSIYEPGMDFMPGSYAKTTHHFPGEKKVFENEVSISLEYLGKREDVLGKPLDTDISVEVRVVKYTPAPTYDTFLKKGSMSPESYSDSTTTAWNRPEEARTKIAMTAATLFDRRFRK